MALGTRVEGWPDTAAAFFLDLQAGRQSWTQDMTETALAYLGTQGYDLTAEDLEVTRRFSTNGSYRSDTALVAADCGDWTATLLLSQVHANGLDFWQVSGGIWTQGERRVSDPVGRRETALYEVEDVAFGQGVTGGPDPLRLRRQRRVRPDRGQRDLDPGPAGLRHLLHP